MIQFWVSATAIFVFGYLGTFIGWWGLVVVAAIVGFIFQMQGFKSFLSGFIGGAVFFGTYAIILDVANEEMKKIEEPDENENHRDAMSIINLLRENLDMWKMEADDS